MIGKKLTVITTCTNLKRGITDPELSLRRYCGKDPKFAARAWAETLQAQFPDGTAAEIYSGSHWIESMACRQSGAKAFRDSKLLVLSAGYGLIDHQAEIVNYSASFAAGPDSMMNLAWPSQESVKTRQACWWSWLNRAWGHGGLNDYFSDSQTDEVVLVILSREYYGAVERELIELISGGLNLFIVSAGVFANLATVSPVVRTRVLPFTDRFKALDPYLAKTNVSLNARLANWLVQNHAQDLASGGAGLMEKMRELSASLPPPVRKPVSPMTDEEVLDFIRTHYPREGDSATRLLRHLRDKLGKSCEQKRFGALFKRFISSQQPQLFPDP